MASILDKLIGSPKGAKSQPIELGHSADATGVDVVNSAAQAFLAAKAKVDEAEAAMAAAKDSLLPHVLRAWVDGNAGRAKPEGGVLIRVSGGELDGAGILASFASVWAGGGMEQLPDDLKAKRFAVTIKSDELPADRAEQFVEEIVALAAKYGAPDAVKAKGGILPVPTFNELRHVRLTAEQNLALEAAGLGTRVAFKAK